MIKQKYAHPPIKIKEGGEFKGVTIENLKI